ncbi:MAG: nucleotidyltransferase family protein [Bacteroidaceae bacterium]|nr:nucleotidyltransferase family protein [Bacteroidaceae bacterium]
MQSIIFSFIQAAIKGRFEGDIPDCDWLQLLIKSSDQGVKGLVWQGITLMEEARVAGAVTNARAMARGDKMEWFMNIRKLEHATATLYDTSVEFAERLSPCQCVVLKGIDYARYWPVPGYREFGDLDIYSVDYDAANSRAQEMGAAVHDGGYKHSHIQYKGLPIENHRYFTTFNGTKQGRETERLLKEFLGSEFAAIGDTPLLSPNPDFTALFMLRHAQLHFIDEGISLRHVLDWLFFLRAEQHNVDWQRVYEAMDKMQMRAFADILTAFCKEYFAWTPENTAITASDDKRLLEKLMVDITSPQPDVYDMRLHKKALRIVRRMRRMVTFRQLLNESYWSRVWQTFAYSTLNPWRPAIGPPAP